FTQSGSTVTAEIPTNTLNVLDGYYQLFAMVDDIPSVSKIIKVENSISVSIDVTKDRNIENYFLVYPNPTSETFTIQLPEANLFDLSIIAADGRKIFEQKNAPNQVQINCRNISAGIYSVKATTSTGLGFIKKLIIQH
ncbi:MAG: T9SS type A sorting domain-containing protein, partial [Sediminibacterium sp.]